MKLIITEKNIAAKKIAQLLCDAGKPKEEKVYSTPIYRYTHNGEEWVNIGLKGHILGLDFPHEIKYEKKMGWVSIDEDGVITPANIPDNLARPPFKKKKPFMVDGVDLKGWKILALPYLVWAPIFKEPAEKDLIRSLKNLAKKADSIVIATDFDREGELIGSDAMHMVQEVNETAPITRARYSALIKSEIEEAFDANNLVGLDQDLADAGESRQYIDLVWGAVLTRYLTLARFGGFGNVRSAGRVQTPTLALVVAKEKEREAFVPEKYWVIRCEFDDKGTVFKGVHGTARFKDEAVAVKAFADVEKETKATVSEVIVKSRKSKPPVPFNTTSLQTAASNEGISPARAMRIAESLYMNGYISYPRVDNTVYPKGLDIKEILKSLKSVPQYSPYCDELLAKGELVPTRGKQETTDHPPIHVTAPADPDKLKPEEWKLYNMIARRFMATLSDEAVIEGTKIELDVNGQPFVARGDVLATPGYRGIYPYGLKKDEQLPKIEKGEVIDFLNPLFEAKQTEPPARYSQGKIVQEMEKNGLGTKSTRASIIERLYKVKYLKNDPIEPSQLGMAVIEALHEYAPHITTPDMTVELDQGMDEIAAGQKSAVDVVTHSRALLAGMVDVLIEHTDDLGEAIADAVTADARVGACPKCGHDLLLKNSPKTRSQFIGCSAWPDCDVTFPVPKGQIEQVDELCPVCGNAQISVRPFRSKPFIICIDPLCSTNYEPDVNVGKCPVCAEAGKDMNLIAHRSERSLKRFIRCENYEECDVSYPLPARGKLTATGSTCPSCGAPVVVVQTQRGPWELCVNMDCPLKEEAKVKKAEREAAKAAGNSSKSAPAKKTATKKVTAKKAPAKKATTKKAATKKTTAKKEPAKKAPAKKTTAKKAPVKKTTTKKSAPKED